MTSSNPPELLAALLKHWRGKRGLSQLDLANIADVSSRHISFIETSRATPSAGMLRRLCAALDVPLRHVNTMLEAAGHPALYPDAGGPLPAEVSEVLGLLKAHHEPFPLVVLDRAYNVLDLNTGASALFSAILPPAALAGHSAPNLARLTFDPNGAHPLLVNFDEVGRELLWRIQREVLAEPGEGSQRELLADILAMPTVRADWREPDLSIPSAPFIPVHLRIGDRELRFVTMVTVFQAPQIVLLDELRIETWLPSDTATADACRELAAASDA
ncbi:MAG: helix-turn-helix transcriptional regulator [Myxococcota bacterium]